jgi:hypothetical protein
MNAKALSRWLLTCAAFAVSAVMLPSCSIEASAQPVLLRQDLIATWATKNGATLMFSAGQKFVANRLDLSAFGNQCRHVSGVGTWQFLNRHGSSGPSPGAYVKGNLIGLTFTRVVDSLCSGAEFTTWRPNSVVGLCLYVDPDSPCTGDLFTKQK